MQRTVQQITQQLIDHLPENDQYYRLDELRSWEFPSFVIHRIKIELERNLAESMIIPKTDWANTQSNAVLDAWQRFVNAIRAEARLPASYAKTVVETAVADIIEVLVQPRKNIPEVIFGTKEKLGYEEVCERVKAVVVYRHFSSLIPRYMQKKNIDLLTRERCKKIIIDADEKLTARYSPLNWAQMLEPLFKLLEGKIDSNLLRLFFEDKKMPRIARQFDLMDDKLTRAQLIEVLSSPELLDLEGPEAQQSRLFKDQSDTSQSSLQVSAEGPEESESEQAADDDEKEKGDDERDPVILFDKNRESHPPKKGKLHKGFRSYKESESEKGSEDNDSLNAIFSQPGKVADDSEMEPQPETSEENDDDPDLPDKEEISAMLFPNDQKDDQPVEAEDKTGSNGQEYSTSEKKETPMWMRYMSEEEIEEYQRDQEEQEPTDEDGFIEDPIIDLTEEGVSDEEIKTLKQHLADDRKLFIKEIFRGSERAFDEAIEEIAGYASWRDVSKYIEKDIFKRNLIDMYSEAAVDFTDRLQSYFLEKQNRNK